MATNAAPPSVARPTARYETGIWSWLATTDHKRIGQLYLYTSLVWFLVGGLEALLIRTQLWSPNGRFVTAEMYNQLFTMHGTTMVFLVIMPFSAAFFNFLIPLQIGARDVAFPRLNAFSYWVFLLGGVFMNVSWLFNAAPDAGWFGYAPLTTKAYAPGINIDFWVLGLQILGLSSLAAAFNFITTIINLRAPGMDFMKMPIFTWMSFVTQFLLALSFPIITVAVTFLMLDRFYGTNFYTLAAGADPLLWQHLFWLFGHPEVYILILPAFGLVSEVLPIFSRKPLFGYSVMVYSAMAIAFLGFGVWAHHMFAVGMGRVADSAFAVMTMLIGIPTGVKIFNWIGTLWGGRLRFTTAMKFGIALIALFTIGGISGVMHSSPPSDLQQTDSYFIVAHFHYVLFGGSMMGLFAGLYFYYPKITGRVMNETLGTVHFWMTFVGMNLTFFPMHFLGLNGMPRRTWTYDANQGWENENQMATVGAFLLGAATLLFTYNWFTSMKKGPVAGNDPWGGATLEWSIPSPPPDYNFAVLPQVTSRTPLWGDDPGPGPVTYPAPAGNAPAPRTAAELHITMPSPTIKPLIAAMGLGVMFTGLIWHKNMPLMLAGVTIFVATLYNWLLTPLEPEHH